jgi:hypothetical protein
MQLLVESCGFKVKEIWGDKAKQPFGSQSKSLIILAEKHNL